MKIPVIDQADGRRLPILFFLDRIKTKGYLRWRAWHNSVKTDGAMKQSKKARQLGLFD